MAKYTVELRKLVASGYDLGMTDYPIFDEAYRATLNAKIINHYYFREIGSETAGQFKFYLNRTLDEVMPYYNQLYLSAALTFNPLHNFNLTETSSRESAGAAETTDDTATANEQTAKTVESDMPQSLIAAANLDANLYASKGSRVEADNAGTDHRTQIANNRGLETYARTLSGYSGVMPAEALEAFRRSMLNIDMQVIEALNDCFMGVY